MNTFSLFINLNLFQEYFIDCLSMQWFKILIYCIYDLMIEHYRYSFILFLTARFLEISDFQRNHQSSLASYQYDF